MSEGEFSCFFITRKEVFYARWIKILYDGFFKEIMNPEATPERLNDFLSVLLGKRVRILKALPNDNTRLTPEHSLLITDIVVEAEDGSVINVEIQKIGYAFPGQRAACYSADLLLRQYKRVRDSRKKKFNYRDIQKTYTIILYERSASEFSAFPEQYCHHFWQQSDTGLEMNLLQEYFFIPLDIFLKNLHNNGIRSKLDVWLTFLSSDEPEVIISIIEKYPEFRPLYEQAYAICRNMEAVMGLFSEELYELDKNTVEYMIDELQAEVDRKTEELKTKDAQLQAALKRIEELENRN